MKALLNRNYNLIAVLLALFGIFFFSAKSILVKMAYEFNVDSVSLLLIRMGIALPFYLVIAGIETYRKKDSQLKTNDYFLLILLGILGYYVASYLDFQGLKYLTASMERLILFIYPTIVVIISALFLKKPVSIQQKWAVAITYIGIFVAFFDYSNHSGTSSNILLGTAMIFGSALTYAIYLVGSGDMIPRIGSVRFTSYAMIISCLAVMLHYSINNTHSVFSYPREVYVLGAGMAVISTIIPSFMLGEAIKRIGASNVAIIGSIGPISTIVLAVIFLGEKITVSLILGTAIVISGVLLLGISKKKKKI